VVQRVADRVRRVATTGDARELRLQPGEQAFDEGAGPPPSHGAPLVRRLAADPRLDGVEGSDAAERFLGDRRAAAREVVEPASDVGPTGRDDSLTRRGLRVGEAPVDRVAVALEDAAVATEEGAGVFRPAPGGVAVGDRGRIGAAPGAIIARDRPKVALLRPPAARIEDRHHGLVREQACGGEEDPA
jgi:hypothetical protein